MPDKDFLSVALNKFVNYGDQMLREKYRKEFESEKKESYQFFAEILDEVRSNDLVSATEAFLELKADDAEVFSLLSRYMGVKDIDI